MAANAFLIRCQVGWRRRESAASITALGRREALLGLGSAATEEEAYRVADGQLAEFARKREEINAGHEPIDDTEAPYLAYRPGDTITAPDSSLVQTATRVVALSVSSDDVNGQALIVPTLGDMLLGTESALSQVTRKMAPGSLGGQAKVSQANTPTPAPERATSPPGGVTG